MGRKPSIPQNPNTPQSPWPARLTVGLGLGLLVAWQAWLTLGLFDADRSGRRLLDEQPVISGRHALHLYHGQLGARVFLDWGKVCAFDPCFQAGYPKTPVFDGGCRPAELFLTLAGGEYRPSAYKLGIAVCYLLLPLVLFCCARFTGVGRTAALLATFLGLFLWWGGPFRSALEVGKVDLLLGCVAMLGHGCLLLRFDRAPTVATWFGLLLSSVVGWFADPPLFSLMIPLNLLYYLTVGPRHQTFWHLSLVAALAGGLGANLYWLQDWLTYWWIRAPEILIRPELAHRTPATVWRAGLWGEPADRAVMVVLLVAATLGGILLNQRQRRPAARMLGLGACGFLGLAATGLLVESVSRMGTRDLVLPALLFAVPLAAHGAIEGTKLLHFWLGASWRTALALLCLIGVLGVYLQPHAQPLGRRFVVSTPLVIGLDEPAQELVRLLHDRTTPDARILWEESTTEPGDCCWSPLLPLLTERAFLGGLEATGRIEHAHAAAHELTLAGRPWSEWSDKELDQFCQRYNVGWVVCRTPAVVERLRSWPLAKMAGHAGGPRPAWLFALGRPHTFALRGQARWIESDGHHIALGDVVPENGEVLLSLHYQAGLRASPARVQVEREVDPYDPIAFIRLKVPGPVARVTLFWDSD